MGNLYKEAHDTRQGSALEARGWKTQNRFSTRGANNKLCVVGNHDAHPSETETTHMDRLAFQQILIP